MRRFQLKRIVDTSGISGTGIVAEGVEFTDGTVAIRWRTKYSSTVFWQSMQEVEAVHCHGGNSVIDWLDKGNNNVALVLEVSKGRTNTLPSYERFSVTCVQDGRVSGLMWSPSWGEPPKAGDKIEIEFDAIKSPIRAKIVQPGGEQ